MADSDLDPLYFTNVKRFIPVLIVLCCCLQAGALEARGGFRLGTTVTMLAGEDWAFTKQDWELYLETEAGVPVTASDYRGWGVTIGVLLELSLVHFVALQPELCYTTYHGGMRLQNDLWSGDWIKLGTVYRLAEAPILLKLRLSEKLSLLAGPSLMVRFIEPKAVLITPDDREDEPIADDSGYKRIACAVVGGIVYRGGGGIFLDLRYHFTLTSFDDFDAPWENDTLFHGVIASVGYLF